MREPPFSDRVPPGMPYSPPRGDGSAHSPPGYEIEREIGRGGAAYVFLARDLKHDRRVAIKVLRPEYADAVSVDRFLEEIHIIAKLHHPHIVALYDSGLWNGVPFYVMPHVEGESLRQRLMRAGRLTLEDAVRVAAEIAGALDYAHRNGVVHRDVKPENVLLAGDHALVADFGIALAFHRAATERLTRTGLAVGTLDYMSPEQASGDTDIDGRTDLYALACVLYEMLSGNPVSARNSGSSSPSPSPRYSTPPPSLRAERGDVSAGLDRLVHRTLSPSPEDRPGSAAEFLRELRAATQVPLAPLSPARRLVLVGAAVAVVVAGAVAIRGSLDNRSATPQVLDRSAYAVFPFRHRSGEAPEWLDGDGCARLLYDAMSRWRGVRLVNDMVASDVWARAQPRTVEQVLAAAESLHAGNVAWGEIVDVAGDSIEIRATSYDVARGAASARQFVVRAARSMAALEPAFAALADSVIVGGQLGGDPTIAGATRDIEAVRAYLEGREAVNRFELDVARDRFTKASHADAGFAHAFLWLARVISWSDVGGTSAREWQAPAERAASLSSQLAPRERAHARALLALSRGRSQEACSAYRVLISADSLDFQAWMGLGECHARDVTVVRDAASPTGWSFRGSLHTSVNAYRRAILLVPSLLQANRGTAYRQLTTRVLHMDEQRIRSGYALLPDTARFGALAILQGDSLAFVARPHADVWMGTFASPPPGHRDAIRWGVDMGAQFAEEWVRALPASADAHEARAYALERLGRLVPSGAGPSALTSANDALALSSDREQRLRLVTTVARLRLKSGAPAQTREIADSVLRAITNPTPREAVILAGLAALTGQIDPIERLSRLASTDSLGIPFIAVDGRRLALPGNLTADALALMNLAAVGAPADALRALQRRVEVNVPVWVRPADRAETRTTLLREAKALAFPVLAPGMQPVDAARNRVLGMHYALARGDSSSARRLSTEVATLTDALAAGRMGMNIILGHAEIMLALRDTAGAIRALDAGLNGLPRARPLLLSVVPEAAAIPRAMLLRAEIASRRGDLPLARRWAEQVVELWRNADTRLAPLVRRAQALAAA